LSPYAEETDKEEQNDKAAPKVATTVIMINRYSDTDWGLEGRPALTPAVQLPCQGGAQRRTTTNGPAIASATLGDIQNAVRNG
jgi:hypothetical protein